MSQRDLISVHTSASHVLASGIGTRSRMTAAACAAALGLAALGLAAPRALAAPPTGSEVEKPAVGAGMEAADTQIESSGFMYKQLAVARESTRSGEGQQITARGAPLALSGKEIKVGDQLPEATLVGAGLETASIRAGAGRVRIVSVVPALGTPTCEQQTHYLSEKNDGLDAKLDLITVSVDKPEMQEQFAADAKIENVTFLSDANEASFGAASGLLIQKPRILARAVMVVDAENVVRYLQVVPELTSMPDMDAAFAFARSLVAE